MFAAVRRWGEHRRQIRHRWQSDARTLLGHSQAGAYYDAQRRAARARFDGNRAEFFHWAKVAAEVARLSPLAEMDMDVVRAIVDEEERRRR